MPGRHNVQNALAAIGVALELGIDDATIQQGFGQFGGVKRRFTKVGEIAVDGGTATVIDDYGHHPVEIRAVLAAAREGARGRVIAVVQPHRFTRLGNLMEEFQTAFNDADRVLVTPVFAAGEQPIEGVDASALVEGLKRRGHRSTATVADADALAEELAGSIRADDMIVCLGAGDITKWAAGLASASRRADEPARHRRPIDSPRRWRRSCGSRRADRPNICWSRRTSTICRRSCAGLGPTRPSWRWASAPI